MRPPTTPSATQDSTPTARSLQPAPPKMRWEEMDAARLIAAVGIIWLHTMPINPKWGFLADFGRFAVPFFVLTAIVLTGEGLRQKPNRSYTSYLHARFMRIYVPFLFATILYVILRDAKHFLRPASTELVALGPWLLITGSAHHLWFLPFILVVSVLVFPVLRWGVKTSSWRRNVLAWGCVLAGLLMALWPSPVQYNRSDGDGIKSSLTYLGSLGWNASTAIFWGITIVCWLPAIQAWIRPRRGLAMTCLMLAILLTLTNALAGRYGLL
ncbi:MAG: acyltransferase [Phycisphaerae bacterium]